MAKLTQKDLLELDELKAQLKLVKEREFEIRNKIIKNFRYGDKLEGVVHKSIEDSDIDIVITLKLNRTADSDAINTLWAEFTEEQRDCIKFTPEVKVGPYKKLVKDGKAGKLLNCISEKPGLATVDLKYQE